MNNRFNLLTFKQLKVKSVEKSLSLLGSLMLCAGSTVAIADDLSPSSIVLEASCAGLSWSEPEADTVSINIHGSGGAYITTVDVGERQFLPSRSANYFIVETNIGPWQTWLTTEPVFYSIESNNGQECESQIRPLTVASENGFLVWEPNEFIDQARAFRPTVNIHAADGSYITTVLATDGRWPATQSGGYFFVAVVGPDRNVGDWRTWRSSEVIQVDVDADVDNDNDDREFTIENFQVQLGDTLDSWRAVPHTPFRNALTTALEQWFPILPDISTDNGFDWEALTLGEREAQCETGSVVADIVDFVQNDNVGRLQIELDFAQCVTNAITHNGQATVFLERSSNGPMIEIRENLQWRDFVITSDGQFERRLTGSERLEVRQTGELQEFRRIRSSGNYSESTGGVLDFDRNTFHFNEFLADQFAIVNGPDSFTAEVTFGEGGTMETRRSGRRQTFNANFSDGPDRDVGFDYGTNPQDLEGVPFDQIELSESLTQVGLTIRNIESSNSLQLRPGSGGGDTVAYTISSPTGATTIEDDFLFPFACDSQGLFSTLDVCR